MKWCFDIFQPKEKSEESVWEWENDREATYFCVWTFLVIYIYDNSNCKPRLLIHHFLVLFVCLFVHVCSWEGHERNVLSAVIAFDMSSVDVFVFVPDFSERKWFSFKDRRDRKKTQRDYIVQKWLIVAPSMRHMLDFTIIIRFIPQFSYV